MTDALLSVRDALEVVDDDMSDGAYFAMMEELTGLDAVDLVTAMEELECDEEGYLI